MADQYKIDFVPNVVQKQFIESQARADLFSSRMGEGKSTALAWAAFYHTRWNPGAIWYLVRDTWENLRATTMKTFFEWFPPGIMGEWQATNREFHWAEGVAKGYVGFLGMDDPQDATKLMSREMAGVGMDEPAPAVTSAGIDEHIFDIALSRLRQKGMNWYTVKLAENNPDESHWTYKRFVDPGTPAAEAIPGGFRVWQPQSPENTKNLPSSYYAGLRQLWLHRPDLVRRFIDGEFGFQANGKAVTPQWSDKIHLAVGLIPVKGNDLMLLWDWGHNPTCIVSQKTPLGYWNILDAVVGEEIGAEELVEDVVRPLLQAKYKGYNLRHIGDPTGENREQTSIRRSPARLVTKLLPGPWTKGPVRPEDRIEPLRAILSRTTGGRGVVQVDRDQATAVWYALRGGWHYHIARGGLVSGMAVKDMHSHPGDAMSYGAAVLFPMARQGLKGFTPRDRPASYFGSNGEAPSDGEWRIGKETSLGGLPKHGSKLILPR